MYAIIIVVLLGIFVLDKNGISKEVSYSQFEQYVEKDHGISKITIITNENRAQGVLTDSLASALFPEQYRAGEGMQAIVSCDVPSADKMSEKIEQWRQSGAFPADGEVKYEKATSYSGFLWAFGPVILLVALWYFMFRRLGGSGGSGGVFNVGKSKAQVFDKDSPTR